MKSEEPTHYHSQIDYYRSLNKSLYAKLEEYGFLYQGTDITRDYVNLFKQKLRKGKIQEHSERSGGSDRDEKPGVDEVFQECGIGVTAYFSMLRALMKAFLGLSILFIPLIVFYSLGGYHSRSQGLQATMLGNLGQAQPLCVHQFVSVSYD